jgi:cytochrome P450
MSKPDAVVAFYDDQLNFTYRIAQDHGPMVQMWPGAVLVTGAAETTAIIRNSSEDFVLARNILDRPTELTKGSARRAHWHDIRRAATAAMPPALIDRHMHWVAQRADTMAKAWLAAGHIEDVKTALTPLVTDSVVRFCFGDRALTVDLSTSIRRVEHSLFRIFTAIIDWPLPIRLLLPREWGARLGLRRIQRQLAQAIVLPGAGGMLDELRAADVPDDDIIIALRSTLLAASGMPAATLAWALVELGRHQDQQQRAVQALREHTGPGVPRYIDWIVNETLRVWPSGFVGRRATRDLTCAGWHIPYATEVMVPLWALHRLAPSFADPEKFRPERWATERPSAGEYLPFGGGSNRCYGSRFGYRQTATAIAAVLSRCELELVGEVQPADALSVLRPANCGLAVRPRRAAPVG